MSAALTLALSLFVLLHSEGVCEADDKTCRSPGAVATLTAKNFDEVVDGSRNVVVLFLDPKKSTRSNNKRLKVFDEVATQFSDDPATTVAKLDVGKNANIIARMQIKNPGSRVFFFAKGARRIQELKTKKDSPLTANQIITFINRQNPNNNKKKAPITSLKAADGTIITPTALTTEEILSGPQAQIVNNIVPTDCPKARQARAGHWIVFNYTGRFDNGTEFGSSDESGPLKFQIGEQPRKVVKGIEQAAIGTCPGQTLTAVVPAELGYGTVGSPGMIPPNATLHFDMKILAVFDEQKTVFSEIDEDHGNSDGLLSDAEIRSWFDATLAAVTAERAKGSKQPLPRWEQIQKMIKNDDFDGDGVVSWKEFSGPKPVDDPAKALQSPGA